MLRRLRGRFGISAPRVAVRTHVPWYLRTAGLGAVVVFAIVMAGWAYDAGRRIAGFDQSETKQIVEELRLANAALEEEVARLRSLLTVSDSGLQIEQAAQKSLSEKNSALAEENTRLKEELVVFGRLAKLESKATSSKAAFSKDDAGKVDDGVSIDRLSVRPDAVPGRYRYSFMLALQGGRRGKETKLNLQIVATTRAGAASDKIEFPRPADKDVAQYVIVLRNFRRIDGRFDVPADVQVGSLEFKISEAGVLKASRSLTL